MYILSVFDDFLLNHINVYFNLIASSDSASESSSGSIGGSIVKAQEQKCQFCDYMSNRRSNLERHMLCMHTADCNQVCCSILACFILLPLC